jgi:hypothetical protein
MLFRAVFVQKTDCVVYPLGGARLQFGAEHYLSTAENH